jgi:hypothetical protein
VTLARRTAEALSYLRRKEVRGHDAKLGEGAADPGHRDDAFWEEARAYALEVEVLMPAKQRLAAAPLAVLTKGAVDIALQAR